MELKTLILTDAQLADRLRRVKATDKRIEYENEVLRRREHAVYYSRSLDEAIDNGLIRDMESY